MTPREALLAAARVCDEQDALWVNSAIASVALMDCKKAILALAEQQTNDLRGAAALAAAAEQSQSNSVDSQQREPLSNGVQSATHPDPAAYLVTYREDDKYGNRRVCTTASLEPAVLAISGDEEAMGIRRELISAEPLYAAPALPGPETVPVPRETLRRWADEMEHTHEFCEAHNLHDVSLRVNARAIRAMLAAGSAK